MRTAIYETQRVASTMGRLLTADASVRGAGHISPPRGRGKHADSTRGLS